VGVSFGIYKIVVVQEEKCRGAGRNCQKQVVEKLKSGIIRPNNSPYSSPVAILVKKKNGS